MALGAMSDLIEQVMLTSETSLVHTSVHWHGIMAGVSHAECFPPVG